jgi:hypothetical protein
MIRLSICSSLLFTIAGCKVDLGHYPGDLGHSSGDLAHTVDAGSSGGDGAAGDLGASGVARLFVSHAGGVGLWNNPEGLGADAPPDVQLVNDGLASGATALALAHNRLLVATADPAAALVAYDGADLLGPGAASAAKIPRSAFPTPSNVGGPLGALRVSADDRLWGQIGGYDGGFGAAYVLLPHATTLTSATTVQATFIHPWSQLAGFAYDPLGGRLFAEQISGAGLLVWNDAGNASGMKSHDFVLTQSVGFPLTTDGTRMYASGGAAINIWDNLPSLSAATAPTLSLSMSIANAPFISAITVRDDTLAVAIQNQGIFVYLNASTINHDENPSFTITHPLLGKTGGGQISKLVLTKDHHLFALFSGVSVPQGILVFRDVTTTPTFVTRLGGSTLSMPTDIALLQ